MKKNDGLTVADLKYLKALILYKLSELNSEGCVYDKLDSLSQRISAEIKKINLKRYGKKGDTKG